MGSDAVDAVQIAGVVASNDFSVWALFLKADIIVKAVMASLFFASIWCWAIIIEKTFSLRKLNKLAIEFEDNFWSGGSLDAFYERLSIQKLEE